MFSKVKSLCNNTWGQLFCTDFQWQAFYLMKSKNEVHLALYKVHQDFGVFHTVIPDNAMELTYSEFQHKVLWAGSALKPVEAYAHNQNPSESVIHDLCWMFCRAMRQTNAPYVLWDHCMELMSEIHSNTALELYTQDSDSPLTKLTGDTNDISHLCAFSWYDPVWFIDITDPLQNKKIARYLGPSQDVGQAMCSKLLTPKGHVIWRTSVITMSEAEHNNPMVQDQVQEFDMKLKQSLGYRAAGLPNELEPYEEEERLFSLMLIMIYLKEFQCHTQMSLTTVNIISLSRHVLAFQ
jgi:hypothetical protein